MNTDDSPVCMVSWHVHLLYAPLSLDTGRWPLGLTWRKLVGTYLTQFVGTYLTEFVGTYLTHLLGLTNKARWPIQISLSALRIKLGVVFKWSAGKCRIRTKQKKKKVTEFLYNMHFEIIFLASNSPNCYYYTRQIIFNYFHNARLIHNYAVL